MDLFSEYGSAILEAFGLTLRLAVFSGVFLLLLGVVLAVFRVSPVPVLRWVGAAVVYTFRNTPLTLVMFFALFGLVYQLHIYGPPEEVTLSLSEQNFWMAVLALSVYTSHIRLRGVAFWYQHRATGPSRGRSGPWAHFLSEPLRLIVLPRRRCGRCSTRWRAS